MNTNAHTNNIALESNFHAQNTSEKTESIYWLDVVDVAVVAVVVLVVAVVWCERVRWQFFFSSFISFIVFGAYEFVNICVMPLFVILYPTKLLFPLSLSSLHFASLFLSVEWFLEWRPNISRQINFCHEYDIITSVMQKDKWLVWWNKFADQPN